MHSDLNWFSFFNINAYIYIEYLVNVAFRYLFCQKQVFPLSVSQVRQMFSVSSCLSHHTNMFYLIPPQGLDDQHPSTKKH